MGYNNQKREEKAEISRLKIYQSAEKLFREQGFEAVSVDAIVKDAKVAKGSFYHHFDSKDQLFALIIQDHVIQKDRNYRQFISTLDSNTTIETIVLRFTEYITEVLMKDIGHDNMSLIYKFSLSKTVDTNSVMNYQRDIYQVLHDLFSRGIREGDFSTLFSADTLAKHYMLLIRSITFEWCARYPDYDYQTEAQEHVKIFLTGIIPTRPLPS